MSKKKPERTEQPRDLPDAGESEQDIPVAGEGERVDVETLTAERDDLMSRLQRVSADYLNYQKRQQRQIAEAHDFANAELARDLLAVLDDMERAMEAAEANHEADDPLLAGMRLVYEKALEILARHGVTPVAADEGDAFDPQRHEAMMQQPGADVDAPTVAQALQRGYEIRGRVLRPARVVVAVPAEPPSPPDEAAGDTDESE